MPRIAFLGLLALVSAACTAYLYYLLTTLNLPPVIRGIGLMLTVLTSLNAILAAAFMATAVHDRVTDAKLDAYYNNTFGLAPPPDNLEIRNASIGAASVKTECAARHKGPRIKALGGRRR